MIRDKFNGEFNQKRNIVVGNHQHLFNLMEKAFVSDVISKAILILDLRGMPTVGKVESGRPRTETQCVGLKEKNGRLIRRWSGGFET